MQFKFLEIEANSKFTCVQTLNTKQTFVEREMTVLQILRPIFATSVQLVRETGRLISRVSQRGAYEKLITVQKMIFSFLSSFY